MIYLQLDGPNWPSKSPIVGSSIFIVVVVFWVTESVRCNPVKYRERERESLLDMFFRSVDTESLGRDLKFGSRVAEGEEGQNPY